MRLDRKCIKCDTEFQLQPHQKASNICSPCKNLYQKKYANKKSKVSMEGYKDPYPYDEKEKIQRFRLVRNQLDKMKQREEWQEYFKQQLYKLETDDIAVLKWIYDRRSHDTVQETIEQPHKKESYNDTRTTHNNTKSWFD